MTNDYSAEEKLMKGPKSSEQDQDEEDDEALSFSDLPLNLIDEDDDNQNQSRKEASQVKETEDQEFNFDSWGGSLSTQSEMCAADDVFFKGQLLPLRFSVSSDTGLNLTRLQHELSRNPSICLSRSESMDRVSSVGRLTSINSSRSSSSRSNYSSSSSSSITTNTTGNTNPKPRIRNQFHTYPSPKPQIRVSTSRLRRNGSGNRSQRATVWDFFRLGLVRAPEIELQDLKVRNIMPNRTCVSRNSSSGSSSNSSCSINYSSKMGSKNKQDLKKQQKRQNFLDKKIRLFSGCKCSFTAVETVPLNNIVIIKSESDGSSSRNTNESSAVHAMEKKLQELKIKKKLKEKQKGKQAMSRHRTFEWLKELSHGSYVDGET